jgi:hypothetical protein
MIICSERCVLSGKPLVELHETCLEEIWILFETPDASKFALLYTLLSAGFGSLTFYSSVLRLVSMGRFFSFFDNYLLGWFHNRIKIEMTERRML